MNISMVNPMRYSEGYNQAVEKLKSQRTKADVLEVLRVLLDMMLAGEEVLVPTKVQLSHLGSKNQEPETLYQVVTAGGRRLHLCYLETEDAAKAKVQGALAKVRLEDLLIGVSGQPAVDGLAVNPYSHDFVLKKELCDALLGELKLRRKQM